tara:strand:- start:121 stop:561 length:441 start_codon:yes stop_codon:yes gene_type:complete
MRIEDVERTLKNFTGKSKGWIFSHFTKHDLKDMNSDGLKNDDYILWCDGKSEDVKGMNEFNIFTNFKFFPESPGWLRYDVYKFRLKPNSETLIWLDENNKDLKFPKKLRSHAHDFDEDSNTDCLFLYIEGMSVFLNWNSNPLEVKQ